MTTLNSHNRVNVRPIMGLCVTFVLAGELFCGGQRHTATAGMGEDGGDVQPTRRAQAVSASARAPQVEFINDQVSRAWQENGIRPSPTASEGEWCRRVYLDLLGRIPSVDELRRFLQKRSKSKKAELISDLLYDERYRDDYVRNWSTIWTNILIGRRGGSERNSRISREGLQEYLSGCFQQNKPYDRMAYELVTATGTNTPGLPGFNGAVNFLSGKLEDNAVQATAETARIFLGLQVQCTQCHNHPFNSWKQNQFWELNAFFRQAVPLRRFAADSNRIRAIELADQDFAGEGRPPTPDNAELYYELRNGELRVAYPAFVDGVELPSTSGFVEDIHRRQQLGELIIQSRYMQDAVVNRMWAHFFGYGFTRPVDDMGPHNPPSHPELLNYLGQQLREHYFDLKQLISWLVLCEPYSLSSRIVSSNASDDPLLGSPPKFSRFYLRQMQAEQLYQSLLVATEAHQTQGAEEEQERRKRQWLQQFIVTFGTDEAEEATTFNGTIPQALMMFNGDLVRRATSSEKGSFLWQIANSDMRRAQKIERLFLAALSREPTRQEIQAANELLVARGGDTGEALRDIWWALLNSNEFMLNH